MPKEDCHFVDCGHSINGDATGDQAWTTNNYEYFPTTFSEYIFHSLLINGTVYARRLTDNGDGTFTEEGDVAGGRPGYDGTYVYVAYSNALRKYDIDFNLITSWQTNGVKSLAGVVIPVCNTTTLNVIVSAGSYLHLLDSDGDEIWNTNVSLNTQWQDYKFDSNDNVLAARYRSGTSADEPSGYRLSASDGAVLMTCTWSGSPDTINDIAENPITNDIILVGKYNNINGVFCWPSTGGGVGELKWFNEITIPYNKVEAVHCALDGSIFVVGQRATNPVGNVHKYTSAGTYVNSYDCGTVNPIKNIIQYDNNSIMVTGPRQTNEDGYTVHINVLSLDLEYIKGHDYGTTYTYTAGGVALPKISISPDPLVTGTQKRTVWYPPDTNDYFHLESESLCVLADGAVHPQVTVSNGAIELNYSADVVHAGLCYSSTLKPMKLDGEIKMKRISEIILQLYNTLGGKFGEDEDNLNTIIFRSAGDVMDDSPALFIGHKVLSFNGNYNRRGDVVIKQSQPLPMKLLGIAAKVYIED